MKDSVGQTTRAVSERALAVVPGWAGLLLLLALKAAGALWFMVAVNTGPVPDPIGTIGGSLLIIGGLICWNGMVVVQPNQAVVVIMFGSYLGTIKRDGWHFANPLVIKRKVSLRVHNFTSPQLKVNDLDGNPIEIAAVVVWRVVDTASAVFDVEDYSKFIEVQSETALRHLASQYPYDEGQHPGEPSLRGSADEVASALQRELQSRLKLAGIDVIEARLSHLAYSPEIAGAMLQRQQAGAIIAARQRIVEGAVGMVEMALDMLSERKVVDLAADQKAVLVSSLLVVLTSERGAHPMLPVGKGG